MPSVNRKSLREEFDQLKEKFKDLSDEDKVTPEVDALLHAMIILFELLITVFMEKKTKKNSRNSTSLLPNRQR